MKKNFKLFFCMVLTALSLAATSRALAPYMLLGAGENVRKQDPPGGGPYVGLHDAMTADGVQSNFVGHWFHGGWAGHFPSGVGQPACFAGGEWNDLASYQAVLNSGRTLVIFWWFHNDAPCIAGNRSASINNCNDCLVPLLNSLTNGNVYVVLEPEYNNDTSGGACGGNTVQKDPSWAAHLNTLISATQAAGGAGLNVKVGASPGDFDFANQSYDLEPSLGPAATNSDFVAFHEIYRSNAGHALPADTYFGNPSPDQVFHALSYARFLKKRYNKPLVLGYWSVASGNYGTAAQADALLDFFENRAQLEAYDVEMFGPFWYWDDPGYAGEGLITAANAPRPAHQVWRDEANAVIGGADRTQSIGFLSPDFGDVHDASGMMNVQWISRGRPNTPSTFSLYYQLSGGPDVLIASGLPGDDLSVMSYPWDPCAVAPAVDVRLKLVSDLGVPAYSGPFDLTLAGTSSNAQHTFDSGAHGWSGAAAWSPQGNAVAGVQAAAAFNGASGLRVGFDQGLSAGWAHVATNMVLSGAGAARLTALIYVPFEMNPVTIPGAPISKVQLQLQWNCGGWSTQTSGDIWLHEGWNRVVWDPPNPDGCSGAGHTEIHFWNKWPAVAGSAEFYVDEIRLGGDLTFSPPPCVAFSPTMTFTTSPTPSNSPSPSPVYSPTLTATPLPGSPTFTPTVTLSHTPDSGGCSTLWNFDDATSQGFGSVSASVTSLSSTTTRPYQGTHSLEIDLDLQQVGQVDAYIEIPGAMVPDLTGETVSLWLWVPAGMSDAGNPTGIELYVQSGGWVWTATPWMNIPAGAGWFQVSFDMSLANDPADVQAMGAKITLGGTSPNWAGTVFLDEFGPAPVCTTPTFTPVITLTSTGTQTSTPTPIFSATYTVTPSYSASPSFSPTETVVVSPTFTGTLTNTPTETVVVSPTFTGTLTNTPTETVVVSPTFTATLTNTSTETVVVSPTFTATLSNTPTETLVVSSTFTGTLTNTPTETLVVSPTFTGTLTNTSTETVVVSSTSTSTWTSTATSTHTPTVTHTATMTLLVSPTFSVTSTLTALPAGVVSPTHTITSTFTATETPMLSPTFSLTASQTSTPTLMVSTTFTPTSTFVLSATFTPTATPSLTTMYSVTLTPTPAGATYTVDDLGFILSAQPVPNPQQGLAYLEMSLKVQGMIEGAELEVFTKAYTKVAISKVLGVHGPGWTHLQFPMADLANGIYYLRVRAINQDRPAGKAVSAKVYILR